MNTLTYARIVIIACCFTAAAQPTALTGLPVTQRAGTGQDGAANWSSFAGNGTFTPPVEGIPMMTTPSEARVAWRLAHPMGIQKSNDAKDGEYYGGTACAIVADGIVFTSYIRPSGNILNEKRTNRYYPLDRQPRTLRQIDADDVTVAVDAETGKLLWQAEEKGAALNFLFGKRGHYGISPAFGNGNVFTWGALGNLYAYDARTGLKRWETRIEPFHAKAAGVKATALAEKNIPDTYGGASLFEDLRTGLIVADGILAAPDGFEGLAGFDTATGQQRWTLPAIISRGATPALWRHDGKSYLLCPYGRRNEGKISLIAPTDGRIVWTFKHAGPAHTSLVVGGDRVFFNTRGNMLTGKQGPGGDPAAGSGLLACYDLALEGPRARWRLEDSVDNRHDIRPDRGMNRRIAIRDGVGYLLIGDKQKLVSVDLETGKVLQRDTRELPGTACSPLLVENRLFVPLDLAHSWRGARIAVYALAARGGFEPLGEIDLEKDLQVQIVTDYEVANEMACWKGRFYTKTRDGLVCLDMRLPGTRSP